MTMVDCIALSSEPMLTVPMLTDLQSCGGRCGSQGSHQWPWHWQGETFVARTFADGRVEECTLNPINIKVMQLNTLSYQIPFRLSLMSLCLGPTVAEPD